MKVESWLTDDDAARLWKVCHGELPESFATDNELKEFHRVLLIIANTKLETTKDRVIH